MPPFGSGFKASGSTVASALSWCLENATLKPRTGGYPPKLADVMGQTPEAFALIDFYQTG